MGGSDWQGQDHFGLSHRSAPAVSHRSGEPPTLAQGNARKNANTELREALRGHITARHRILLELLLEVISTLEHTPAELDAAVGKALAPIQQHACLTKIPGVGDLIAQVLLAEICVDMTRFPDTPATWCRGRGPVPAQ